MITTTAIRSAPRQRIGPRRILVAVALALTGVTYMTAPIAPAANAANRASVERQAVPWDPCPNEATTICLYEYPNYNFLRIGARHVEYEIGDANMADSNGPRFNDMASSIYNNTPFVWCAYDYAGYDGLLLRIEPHSGYGLPGTAWDNRISSIRKLPSTSDSC